MRIVIQHEDVTVLYIAVGCHGRCVPPASVGQDRQDMNVSSI